MTPSAGKGVTRYRVEICSEVDPTETWWRVKERVSYGWHTLKDFLPTRAAARRWLAARRNGRK